MPDSATDVLILEGKRHRLCATPLESYLKAKRDWPRLHCPKDANQGYAGTWEIVDGRLYLIDLIDKSEQGRSIGHFFPDSSGRIPATWFTGRLRYVTFVGFCGLCGAILVERYSLLEIEQGRLVAQYAEPNDRSERDYDIPAFLRHGDHTADADGQLLD